MTPGVAQILDDLYAGALDPVAWDRAMVAIADIVRASGALLFAFNPVNGAVLRDEIHRFDPRIVEDYRRHWAFHDDRVSVYLASPVNQPVREVTLPPCSWRRSEILNEFLLPVDAPYNMAAWLHKSPTKAVALALQGPRRRGPFEDQDVEVFRQFLPHVWRALEIRDRLEAASVRIESLASCIDRVNFGVIALGVDGKILHTNVMAEKIIGVRPDRTLVGNGLPASRFWRRLEDQLGSNSRQEQLIRIDRGPGRWPISIVTIPMREVSVRWAAADASRMLFLFDPELQVTPRVEVVAKEFGVSGREAEIAVLLSMGLELSGLAKRLSISIHTARTHLKSLYGKTGIRSQAELVRRVLSGPSACFDHRLTSIV